MSDITNMGYPEFADGLQLLPGPIFMNGGYVYSYSSGGNSWERYINRSVKTILLSDHLITPSAGYNFETDWFTILEFANAYKLQFKGATGSASIEWQWRTVDEAGNVVNVNTIPGTVGGGGSSASNVGLNFPVIQLKIAIYTVYAASPGEEEPAPGTSAGGIVIRLFIGGIGEPALNVPENGEVIRCITFRPNDNLHADYIFDVFTMLDAAQFNNYMATHGNPIPSDYPVLILDGMPADFDPSRPGGGDGNYDDKSDPIDFPDMPIGGAISCGAIKAFHVSTTNISNLFHKLWDKNVFDPEQWQKLTSSPMDCIVSLHALPIDPATIEGAEDEIYLGSFGTNIRAKTLGSQYFIIDCGYIDLIKFFGSAMDFSPYTEVQIYLPGAGIYSLATEDVQGSRIHVKYFMDVLTGDVLIHVKCGQSVLYKFTGNMKMQIPVSARENTALGSAISGVAGVIGGAVQGAIAGGGAGAIIGGVAGGGISTAASVATRKEHVSRSGDMSGSISLMDHFVPYLIIHRPQQSLAPNYNKFKGYPANLTLTLGACSGYTEVAHIHLTGISGATDTELNEIEQMLKAGVII